MGIECFVLNADIPQIAKDTNVSEETAGRNVRYNFFNKLCEKYDINKVATAHNRNDNARNFAYEILCVAVRQTDFAEYRMSAEI